MDYRASRTRGLKCILAMSAILASMVFTWLALAVAVERSLTGL